MNDLLLWLLSQIMPAYISSFLFLITALLIIIITRGITICHYSKHHMDNIAKHKIEEEEQEISGLEAELRFYQQENEALRIKLKTIKAAIDEIDPKVE